MIYYSRSMDEEELRPGFKQWWRSLAREQKIAVALLSICGLVVFVLAIGYVQAQVLVPFRVPKNIVASAQDFFAKQESQDPTQQMEDLKKKDTDRDGLSDYDETYVYHTSPYLPDSDSDGIPDFIEVLEGTNPNCPEGKTCVPDVNDIPLAASSTFQDLLDAKVIPATAPGMEALTGVDASSSAQIQEFLNAPPSPDSLSSAAQIRDYFVSHHLVTADELNQLTDDQVKSLYAATYQEAKQIQEARAQNGLTPNATSTNTETLVPADGSLPGTP
ncbi:MAG TPA: hypothetical protein VFQ60_00010 [Patescibacteria group bacterium]|nr:hypothetical protein [Patescibacteria group bacterium]